MAIWPSPGPGWSRERAGQALAGWAGATAAHLRPLQVHGITDRAGTGDHMLMQTGS